MNNLVENKYGYVEDVEDDTNYKNIDYRDTLSPLWKELYNRRTKSFLAPFNNRQNQINLALCASIIQLSNHYIKDTNNRIKIMNKIMESHKEMIEENNKKIAQLEKIVYNHNDNYY